MHRRERGSLLWGAVGTLSFLVLVQGYELVANLAVGLPTKLAVGLAVGVAASGLSSVASGWLEARSS
jgi:hypothetical protein